MSAKRSRSAPGAGGGAVAQGRRRRGPAFPLTPEQVIARCLERGHEAMCAGEVLALMELMVQKNCCAYRLHVLSEVSYAMIADILRVDTFPTTNIRAPLARALGMQLPEFETLAYFCLREQR